MKKILVIDDDKELLKLIQLRLEKGGYKVECANDGLEGIAKIDDFHPDLVILDVMMPHLDGYSLLQEMKFDLDLRQIPILVLSGRQDLKDIFDHMGKVEFVPKPFDSKELLGTVKECLAR